MSRGGPVRSITEGYAPGDGADEGFHDPTLVPHGQYVGETMRQDGDEHDHFLIGTAAYWDGKWDHGDDDGENAPIRNDDPLTGGDYYGAFLVLDGEPLEGAGTFFEFRKSA